MSPKRFGDLWDQGPRCVQQLPALWPRVFFCGEERGNCLRPLRTNALARIIPLLPSDVLLLFCFDDYIITGSR